MAGPLGLGWGHLGQALVRFQHPSDGGEKRVLAAPAHPAEVVHLHGPDEGSGQVSLHDVVRLK